MAKKEIQPDKIETICRDIEYCILPVFIILCLFSLKFAIVASSLAGLVVSALELIKAFYKHNK